LISVAVTILFIYWFSSVVIFGVPNICLANSELNPNISDIITIALSTSVNPDETDCCICNACTPPTLPLKLLIPNV
jgi:hypothetical protein